jgi:hypothetical protein
MKERVKQTKFDYLKLISQLDRLIKWMPETGVGYQKKLTKCAEFWWLHKGTIPANTIAILLKVERTDLINLLNAQIIERGTYIR